MPELPQYILDNIANAALDFHMDRGTVYQQAIQDKPLVQMMERNAKTFPGGKGKITIRVQGNYGTGNAAVDGITGYVGDDSVGFTNPANIKTLEYTWREHHMGFSLTHTELKHDGISITDAAGDGSAMSRHSNRDATMLANIFDNKMTDFMELKARSMNDLLWGDGTADPKAFHGLTHFIRANPLAGTVGGIDASLAANSWWRNRARTAAYATAHGSSEGPHGGDAVTSTPQNGGALAAVLQKEMRQLRRFGGRPTATLCGSDFLAALENEIRANGYYSNQGFTSGQDLAVGDVRFGPLTFRYDPSLDDLSLSKRAYIWDPRVIFMMKMEGEWEKRSTPARPADKFVMYRSITWTGQMVCRRRNAALAIDIK